MFTCPVCGTEWRSELARDECEENDRREDLNTRQFFANYQGRQ